MPKHDPSADALAIAAEWRRVEEMKGDFYGITYNPFLNSGAGAWVCSFYATNRLLLVHTGPTPAAAIIAAHEAWQKEQGK